MTALFRHIRDAWMRFLDKLAQANKESLGSERLECCDLNKPHKTDTSSPKTPPKP